MSFPRRLLFVLFAMLLSATSAAPIATRLLKAAPREVKPAPYTIYRTATPITIDGKLDEPGWFAAPSVGEFQFAWYKSGKREQTVAKFLWDDKNLYVSFICQDAHIAGTRTKHDSDVWEDDCVEVFTAPNPDLPMAYFNIEMNVRGAHLDGYHPSKKLTPLETNWNAEGIQIKTSVVGTLNNDSDTDTLWILEAAIPFAAFAHVAKHTRPLPDDVWHLNLNRLGGNTNSQYSQWSPGTSTKPQYHRPQDFGRVIFSDATRPVQEVRDTK
ncbi:hypothetical protein CA54_34330 [Symmachiella macrocystis]|uniref:Carbohydrate-binding domain-containing protein n=1 Tax=Symmachiella macrocystis TaxID=2527985 RepID=A0A5C6BV53_9PLAN|nr:carbohydrate-binding family 9-like protein [Symmachiella macrocystis]TWU14564.1 hypothetical protein CA54_34330 [Symmachiella macrocystis]